MITMSPCHTPVRSPVAQRWSLGPVGATRSNNNPPHRTPQHPTDDPDHLLEGFDRNEADLSWNAPATEDTNRRTGEVWLYPKKRGNEPSNLEDFREGIKERTRNSPGVEAITKALIEKGVDTNGKALSAQRIRLGIRTKGDRPASHDSSSNTNGF
ncbi:hypothetical protein DHEL01_v202352 [Diaporthe helianthi]|uniref:Uncharacterized protein n=1 Tax=Diaporthe helianthi TaxID=158607 RepID=A0A2P5I9T5_DIAHE|nr:hypothetical protein DHEL01_v202352 [Diaporthe helianthi]